MQVFFRRLLGMTTVAQRPPVARIPEQLLIPAMRYHMIHICGPDVSPMLQALLAQRMSLKKFLPRNLPGVTVAASGG